MTGSPFLPQSGRSRRARALARHRRRRRRRLAIATIALALVIAAAVGLMASGGFSANGHNAQTTRGARNAGEHARPSTTSSPVHSPGARSRLDLALGKPPLPLSSATGGTAVQAPFHDPPTAGLLFNLDTGQVLWARQATRILPIASLTKMMTALLVVRARAADTPVLITARAVNAQGSKVGLLPLHKYVPLETLLYGLLLPSGNDAAVALAENVAGSVSNFVEKMNVEAAKLGLGCTRYTSPDGLDNGNTSCATDLAELASVDLQQPRLAKIMGSASAIRPFPIKGGKLYLYNNNPLLRYEYPGATGMKTGETEAAGLCLVGTAERHGVRLGVVLLHSPELGRQAEYLLDRGFQNVYGQAAISAPPVPPGR